MMPLAVPAAIATGAGTTTLEHFRTQRPYALANGAIALAGFLIAGFAYLPCISIAAVASQFVVVWIFRQLGRVGSGRPRRGQCYETSPERGDFELQRNVSWSRRGDERALKLNEKGHSIMLPSDELAIKSGGMNIRDPQAALISLC